LQKRHGTEKVEGFQVVAPRDVVLRKEVWNAPKELAILIQLQTHFKVKRKKAWERRSHAFPPHYNPGCPLTVGQSL